MGSTKDNGPQEESRLFVAGVGASAGGVDALKDMFTNAPTGAGIAYVIAQHVAPSAESHMADILSHCTDLAVCQAEDGMEMEADHVYTIPAGKFLTVADGHLALSEARSENGKRVPIDYLFRSLADVVGARAICVVLSGSGSDGALGLREVHAAGGLCVAQDPEAAEYDSMPTHAVETGMVDFTLPAADISEELAAYVRRMTGTVQEAISGEAQQAALGKILDLIEDRTGRDYRSYKDTTVLRRIQRRMSIREAESVAKYLEVLRQDEEEIKQLSREMLIGVTSFFREGSAFEALKEDVLKKLVANTDRDDTIRIWVPGCSTGEEAYTMAIVLDELRREMGKPNCKVQIFATDLDTEALNTGRNRRYPENIEGDVTPARLNRYFHKVEGKYEINQDIREAVVFAPHNLLGEPPFSNLDLISCRNVLIYLERKRSRRYWICLRGAWCRAGICSSAHRTAWATGMITLTRSRPSTAYTGATSGPTRRRRTSWDT
jgi:two-component system CheB/CheR fusion protein